MRRVDPGPRPRRRVGLGPRGSLFVLSLCAVGAGTVLARASLGSPVDAAAGGVWRVAFAAGVAVLTAGAVSVAAARAAAGPLRRLREAAQRMAGDPAARCGVGGSGEIGALGDALDRLAATHGASLARVASARDRLEAVLETVADGVLLTGDDGKVVLANPALRTMIGATGSVVGAPPGEALGSEELAAVIERAARGGVPASAEIDGLGVLGRRVRVRAAPLAGPRAGVVAVLTDVTDLRRLESARRDFVANVSHELRTPLAAVCAALETLESGAAEGPQGERELVAIAGRHALRLRRLVEDVLELSRIEAQAPRLGVEAVEVAEMLDRVVALHEPAARRHGVALWRAGCPPGLRVRADSRALEQVLSNLVDNAVKYAARASVTLSASARDGEVRIAVTDTGPGIAPEHLPRLFERFYRVDPGRSRDLGGTGLGLSIVKHLCESMGGRAVAQSAPGEGSTFAVVLPEPGFDAAASDARQTSPSEAEASR